MSELSTFNSNPINTSFTFSYFFSKNDIIDAICISLGRKITAACQYTYIMLGSARHESSISVLDVLQLKDTS